MHNVKKKFNITGRVAMKNVSYYPGLLSPSPFPQMHSLLPFLSTLSDIFLCICKHICL